MKQEGDPGWTKLMNNAMSTFLKKAVVLTAEYLPYSKCAKKQENLFERNLLVVIGGEEIRSLQRETTDRK